MDLGDRAGSEKPGADAERREQHGERLPFPAEPALDVVEGTAQHASVRGDFAVLHRQQTLGVLGRHAEQGGDLHPEERAGTAGGDGGRHADDVAGADGGGEGGAERTERTDFTVVPLALMEHVPEGAPEMKEVSEAKHQREHDAGCEDGADERDAPYEVVHLIDDLCQRFQRGGKVHVRFSILQC